MWLRTSRFLGPWLAAHVLLVLGGCSATGEPFAGLRSPSATEAQVLFYRPDKLRGVDALPTIFVDDEEIGKLRNAGWLRAQVRPGSHRVTIDSGPGSGKVMTKVEVAAGESIVFRAMPGEIRFRNPIWLLNHLDFRPMATVDSWSLQRIANEAAEEEMQGLRRSQ